ncbi:hypothetical protein F4779DRAFT_611209 [Xylariaceae sp. FL0662B]|nr:hypothetical protein F4779DRAFT_611209 [Xylariaceae sp. FL0662B]
MSTSVELPTVFVTSATGSQGLALCLELRQSNWNVCATTRDPASPAASVLEAAGVQLTLGDWDNEDSLLAGITGCDKLFLCLLPDFSNFEVIPRRAERIICIVRAAGVQQVVVSTILGTFMIEEGGELLILPSAFFLQHFQAKKRIEQAVIKGDFDSCTLLRPAFFMANFLEPKIRFGYSETREKNSWTNCMTSDIRLGLVDHVDIARFVAAVFREPDKFYGLRIGIASEELPV